MTTDADLVQELGLSNVGYTHGMKLYDTTDGSYGLGLCQNGMNGVSASVLSNNKYKQDRQQHQYNDLKKRRKGLIFRTIDKKKDGLFFVSVQVDNVDFFGKGPTIKGAKNDCAANVLSVIDSALMTDLVQKECVYKNAFNKLKRMYSGLLFQTLPNDNDRYDVYVEVDGIEYYGNGKTMKEANNETAWAALKSIISGDHKKKLQENEEYWYDEENIFEDMDNCHLDCRCPLCPYY